MTKQNETWAPYVVRKIIPRNDAPAYASMQHALTYAEADSIANDFTVASDTAIYKLLGARKREPNITEVAKELATKLSSLVEALEPECQEDTEIPIPHNRVIDAKAALAQYFRVTPLKKGD